MRDIAERVLLTTVSSQDRNVRCLPVATTPMVRQNLINTVLTTSWRPAPALASTIFETLLRNASRMADDGATTHPELKVTPSHVEPR